MNALLIFLTFLAIYLGAAGLAITVLVGIGLINATRNTDRDYREVEL